MLGATANFSLLRDANLMECHEPYSRDLNNYQYHGLIFPTLLQYHVPQLHHKIISVIVEVILLGCDKDVGLQL